MMSIRLQSVLLTIIVPAFTAAVALSSSAAIAQSTVKTTAPQADPRREGGAKVTQETAPRPEKAGNSDGDSDGERLHNAFQPKGVEMGSFLLLPKIETDVMYSSNLYATENNPKPDMVGIVRPEMRLRSRFATHALNITGNLESMRHLKYKSDDVIDGRLAADGRYDLSSTDELNGLLDFVYRHEDRGSPDDAGGKKPTPTTGLTGKVSGKHKFGRFTFEPEATVARRVFGDATSGTGTKINNADRDRIEMDGRISGSYEIFPGYAFVVAAGANVRRYDDRVDDSGYERSSRGWRVDTGVAVDLTDMVRGDFLIGYLKQDYEDQRLSDPSGPAVRAVLNWTPSKLTLVVPSLERTVQETTSLGASSIVRTAAGLLVRHEYGRNVLLTGNLNYSYDTFEGLNRVDTSYEVKGRVTYAIMPEAHVSTEVRYKIRDSNASNSSYDQAVVGVRLSLQM